jgi:hypothetical protein
MVGGLGAKITIGATLQVESQTGHLVTAILSLAEISGVVRHDGRAYSERRVACGQASSDSRSIVDEGTERDGRLTTEVVVEATSPGGGCIARYRAVGYSHLSAIVQDATSMLGSIATEERVIDGHLAASADEQAAATFVGFPIGEGKPFKDQVHAIDQEHSHAVASIQDDGFPTPIQGQISPSLAFSLDGERAGECDRARTCKRDRIPVGRTADEVLKLAIIVAIGDGKNGHEMLSPFGVWTSRLLSHW